MATTTATTAMRTKMATRRKRRQIKDMVKPHKRLTKKCRWCGVTHPQWIHRFHGKGSYYATHKKARARKAKQAKVRALGRVRKTRSRRRRK